MAIKSIPRIYINGGNPFASGYIYSLDYQCNFGNSPSSMTISLVPENTDFTVPLRGEGPPHILNENFIKETDELKAHTIMIEGNKHMMYLIAHNVQTSPEEKTASLTFIDGSFILDQINVGLHKRHGLATIPSGLESELFDDTTDVSGANFTYYGKPKLLCAGLEFHPCDYNKDGKISFDDILDTDGNPTSWRTIDACDPCPFCPEDKYKNRCEDISCASILDVGYNFATLLSGMLGIGIEIKNVEDIVYNKNYYTNYAGTLREVIGNWCSDFGYDFFWETLITGDGSAIGGSSTRSPKKTPYGRLVFYDVKNGIEIDDSGIKDSPYLISKTVDTSFEGTESRHAISYYQREGERKNYVCEISKKIDLTPFTTAEYITNYNVSGLYNTATSTTNINEDRFNMLALFSQYQGFGGDGRYTRTLRDAYVYWYLYNLKSASAFYSITGQTIPEIGGMKILDVFSKTINSGKYLQMISSLDSGSLSAFTGDSGFFTVVKRDIPREDSQLSLEAGCGELLGSLFYHKYRPRICGKNNRHTDIKLNGPDLIGGDFFSVESGSGQPLNVPLFEVPYYDAGSNLGELDKWIGGNIELAMSVVVAKKNSFWFPSPKSNQVQDFIGSIASKVPSPSNGQTKTKYLDEYATEGSGIDILWCYEIGNTFQFSTSQVSHPYEKANIKLEGELVKTECREYNLPSTGYGLESNLTVSPTMQLGSKSLTIYPPSLWHPTLNNFHYQAVLEQKYTQEVIVPKYQSYYTTFQGTGTNKTLRTSLNIRTINDGDIRIIEKTGVSGFDCIPKDETISGIHRAFMQDLNYENDKKTKRITYKLAGLEGITGELTPDKGVVSMGATFTDRGVTSTVSFANQPSRPPSLDYVRRTMEMGIKLDTVI